MNIHMALEAGVLLAEGSSPRMGALDPAAVAHPSVIAFNTSAGNSIQHRLGAYSSGLMKHEPFALSLSMGFDKLNPNGS